MIAARLLRVSSTLSGAVGGASNGRGSGSRAKIIQTHLPECSSEVQSHRAERVQQRGASESYSRC
jgi:hypothetical protein